MPTMRWTLDLEEYAKLRMDRPSPEAIRKYYGGFKMAAMQGMFDDEFEDLEMMYKSSLVHLEKEVADCLPSLLHYMEEFLKLHKTNEAIREKLDALFAKTGRSLHDESEGEDE